MESLFHFIATISTATESGQPGWSRWANEPWPGTAAQSDAHPENPGRERRPDPDHPGLSEHGQSARVHVVPCSAAPESGLPGQPGRSAA